MLEIVLTLVYGGKSLDRVNLAVNIIIDTVDTGYKISSGTAYNVLITAMFLYPASTVYVYVVCSICLIV